MDNIASSIKFNSIVEIKGNRYKAVGMAAYVTQSNDSDIYYKVFFEGHYALVVVPSDGFMYFGKDVGSISEAFPPPEKINHSKLGYRQSVKDYQIVKEIIFGNILDIEGEVEFVDYECSEDESKIISVGRVVRTKKRADIVAEVIEIGEVKAL